MKIELDVQELRDLMAKILLKKTETLPDREGDYRCDDCERWFVSRRALDVHRGRIHKVLTP